MEICKKALWTRLLYQLSEAVAYLHAQGLVHRDIKPQNFVLAQEVEDAEDAIIKLIDFGLARKFEPGEKLRSLVYTPHYVAPEVLSRRSVGRMNSACEISFQIVGDHVSAVSMPTVATEISASK